MLPFTPRGLSRSIDRLEIVPFDLPDGTIVGYYPELNPLIALAHHDHQSKPCGQGSACPDRYDRLIALCVDNTGAGVVHRVIAWLLCRDGQAGVSLLIPVAAQHQLRNLFVRHRPA